MKIKIFIYALSISFFTLVTSCKKALDVDPYASLSPEIVGAPEATKLLTGVYDALQNGNQGSGYFYMSYVMEDLSADNLTYRATFFQHGEIQDNAIKTDNVLVSRFFNAPYVVIQRANDLLEILAKPEIADDVKKPMQSQAYFLRAYAYYKLVTMFGPVPVVLNRDVVPVPRNTQDEVYKQIEDDLKLSIAANGAFVNDTYASVWSAKALLARVYLIRKNYPEAKRLAEEVIGSSEFSLASSYASMFTKPYASDEHIFKLNFTVTEGEQALDYFLQHPSMPGGGRAELPVDISLVNAYEPGDTRKAASVQEVPAPTANSGWYAKKYQDPAGDGAVPIYILRLAEMYLISAEAQFKISNNSTDGVALGRLNEVRNKRGLGSLTTISMTNILQERRVELAFEGARWTDMKRTPSIANPSKSLATVFLEAKGRSVNDELYPIPQSAINTNTLLLPNNPGY